MTRTQMQRILERFDRWGVNYQPTLDEVLDTLEELPVKSVRMEGKDTLVVTFHRPLEGWEVWNLCMTLRPDEPGLANPGPITSVTLWWD